MLLGLRESTPHVTMTRLMTSHPRYVIALLLVGLGVVLWRQRRKNSRYPPGLPVLPIVGSLPFLDKSLPFYMNMHQLSKKYGNIFSLSVGMRRGIFISGAKTIREAYINNGVAFAGRPETVLRSRLLENPHNIGIADGTYTPEWRAQRNVMMSLLRSLGYGKSTTEDKIQSECEALVKLLEEHGETPWDPERYITISVTNVICHLLFGERYDHKDDELAAIMRYVKQFLQHLLGHPEYEFIPFLQYLPMNRGFIRDCDVICKNTLGFVKERIEKRRKNYDPEQPPSDLIEAYLQQLHQSDSRISEDWLKQIGIELFIAGTESTATTLSWALLYMLLHQDIQTKVQAELDKVLCEDQGSYRAPRLSDRADLAYIEATIMETQRMSSLQPISVPRCTTRDVELEGYLIPKGTIIWINVYGTTKDPDVWEDPEIFNPKRFLDDAGQLVRKEDFLPFGNGRRACIGEQLAKQELFLFFTTILHNFRLTAAPDRPRPTIEPQRDDVILKPQPYAMIMTKRH